MTLKWPFVLFDMDGTLIDSAEMVIKRYVETFVFFDVEIPNDKELHALVGPSAAMSMTKYLGSDRAQEGISFYRSLAQRDGLMGLQPFSGIPEMIKTLHTAGIRMAVATSKPEKEAEKILLHVGLSRFFEVVAGASDEQGIHSKPDVMKKAISQLKAVNHSEVAMVGDRIFDVEGAEICGVDSIFVSWGGADLSEAGNSIAISHSPQELAQLLLSD